MRFLYVENHAAFAANVVRQFLAAHTVRVVSSLATARDALAREQFDLLLVDYDLDDGKGDALVKELRVAGSRVAMVAVSAHDERNNALLAADATAVGGKTRFDQIQEVIDRVAARKK
jgi:DNA-binding response OmpR family regulator